MSKDLTEFADSIIDQCIGMVKFVEKDLTDIESKKEACEVIVTLLTKIKG